MDFFEKNAPFGAEVHVEPLEAGMGWAMNPDCEATQDALTSLKEAFGIDPVNKGRVAPSRSFPNCRRFSPTRRCWSPAEGRFRTRTAPTNP